MFWLSLSDKLTSDYMRLKYHICIIFFIFSSKFQNFGVFQFSFINSTFIVSQVSMSDSIFMGCDSRLIIFF